MSWQTSLTSIEPNKILVRGYPLDEMMGRLSFAESTYLLLMGELPPPAVGRMFAAILVSSIDHGFTPPSTLPAAVAARRPYRRHLRSAAQGLRRGRHPRFRTAPRRRHRDVHAVSGLRARS